MPSYNKVILVGNLTRDPEVRYTASGTAIAKFGLAINRTWRGGDGGEQREETTFVDVDAFGKQAEVIGQYCRKGRPFMVEGRLRTDSWEDKSTGQKRSRLGVVLESFQFLDSRGGAEGGGDFGAPPPAARGSSGGYDAPPRSTRPAPNPGRDAPTGGEPPLDDDDVPF